MWIFPDQSAVCRMYGSAELTDVHLECGEVILPNTYIQLTSQTQFKIINSSPVPVHFDWKMMLAKEEELAHKANLIAHLDQQEADEREALMSGAQPLSDEELSDNDSDNEREFFQLKAAQLLSRKYKQLRLEVNEDQNLFKNENFWIEPASGDIWPNGFTEVTINFRPAQSTIFSATAYVLRHCESQPFGVGEQVHVF